MMYGFNYERLTRITETQKPYRGSTNRYPMERRTRNEKYFLVEMENGEKVYDIVYGKGYHHEKISKETYDTLKVTEPDNVWEGQEWDEHTQKMLNVYCHYRRWTTPNVLARVRPDNTVEFTKKEYHQGDRHFLSQCVSNGTFIYDSRRGGLIYKKYGQVKDSLVMHAIYEGMRITCDSDIAVVPYEIELKKIDRKKAKETLKPYEDFFAISEVMCKTMPYEVFKDTAIQVVAERLGGLGEVQKLHHVDRSRYLCEAEKLVQTAPLDALILYALAYDVNRFAWSFQWGTTYHGDNGEKVVQIYMGTKRRLLKELYKAHGDVFKVYRVQGGKYFPSNEWGTDVIVNGEVVRQL